MSCVDNKYPGYGASLVAQTAKNPPAIQETWVPSLDGEDCLEKGMATHSCPLAWRIPWREEPSGLSPRGRKESDTTKKLTVTYYLLPWIWCAGKALWPLWPSHSQIITSTLLFRHSVMSDSLQSQGLQHARLPCPSPSPRVCSNSCPLSRWCHPTISSFVNPFSPCPQSFPASGSFPVSWLLESSGQRIGVSASASVPSMNI